MVSKDEAYKSWEQGYFRAQLKNKEPESFAQVGEAEEAILVTPVTTDSQHGQIITAPQMTAKPNPQKKGKKRGN